MTLTDRLDQYRRAAGLEAVWFARPNSFAWLTGGGDNVVDREGDIGVAAAGYDGDGVRVVANNIEAPRLRDEELDGDVTVATFDWPARPPDRNRAVRTAPNADLTANGETSLADDSPTRVAQFHGSRANTLSSIARLSQSHQQISPK